MKRNVSINKLLICSSYIYLTIPLIIFFLFWFDYHYSFLFTFILLVGLFLSLRMYTQGSENSLYPKDNKNITIISIIVLFLWISLSGIGGFGFQNSDYDKHNAILRDLINYSWPVHYKLINGSGLLIYYIGYYLPSALVGKILGWKVANIFIFIWSFIGLLISYLWAAKHIKKIQLKL
ncbi:hypothetical protein [Acetoanaerobium noterae]|uniref:hypothetical protein n=1 Tax=Acetoanaerobium noterae TaxID=745369 RepID=UPI0028A7BD7E|nr:hypothetical protein [Acetoanaerobium noterae]